MRRTLLMCMLLGLLWAVSIPAHAETAAMVPNGGFEEASPRNPARPDGWSPPKEGAWAEGVARGGRRSLHIARTEAGDCYWSATPIRIVPGREYVLQVWVKTEDVVGNARAKLFGGGTGASCISQESGTVSGTQDWTPVTMRLSVPEGARSVSLILRLTGTGKVWFDDVAMAELGPTTQPALVPPVTLARDFPERMARLRAETKPPAGAGEVRLTVHNLAAAVADNTPVSRGVPFPQGEVGEQSAVDLTDAQGQKIPSQHHTLATWPDGSVKWLLVSWAASVPASGKADYLLHYAPPPSANPPALPQVKDGALTLRCGRVQVACREGGRVPFDSVQVDESGDGRFTPRLTGTESGGWLTDAAGERYAAVIEPGGIRVEECGPVRAVVKVQGWYVSAAGKRFCRHETRLYLHAGLPRLVLHHSFIYTGEPDTQPLQGFGLTFSPAADTWQQARIGGAGPTELPLSVARTTLVQSDWNAFDLKAGGARLASGAQAPGWMWLGGKAGGLLLACRDFWQTHPKSLYAAQGECGIGLWAPEAGKPLNLKRHSPVPVKMPSHGGECAREDGVGVSKTHEITLLFSVPAREAEPAATVALAPPVPTVPPAWIAKSGAMGDMAAPEQCPPDVLRAEQLTWQWLDKVRHAWQWYGMTDWGDFKESFYGPDTGWSDAKLHMFLWNNDEIDMCAGPWVWALHSGDPQALAVAEQLTWHLRDVDTVQWDDKRPWRVGGCHRHSPQHWADLLCACHTFLDNNMLHYFVTGDRRSYETCVKTGDFCLANCDKHGLIIHVRPTVPPEQGAGEACFRDFGGAMHNLINAYQLTWDHRYYDRCAHMLEFVANGQIEDGRFAGTSVSDGRWGGGVQHTFYTLYNLRAMWFYHRLTGDEQVKRTFLRGCDGFMGYSYQSWALTLYAYAYQLTGQPRYMAAAESAIRPILLRINASPGDSPEELIQRWGASCSAMIFLRDVPYWAAQRSHLKGNIQELMDQALADDLIGIGPREARPFRVRGAQKTFYWKRDPAAARALTVHKTGYGPQVGDIKLTLSTPEGKTLYECAGLDREREDWDCLLLPDPQWPAGVLKLTIASAEGGGWDVGPASERVVLDVSRRLVLGVGGRGTTGARKFFFQAPKSADPFSIVLTGWKEGRVMACLFAPDGTVAARLAFDAGKPGEANIEHKLTARAAPDQQGKIWSFAISFPDDIHLRVEGIPPYFSLRPESWFNPAEEGTGK